MAEDISASQQSSWTAPAERSGDGAFGRTSGNRIWQSVSGVQKRRGAALPAAVHDAALFALLFGFILTRYSVTAATNSAVEWDTTARITTGLGYRDNVLRSSVASVGSAFFNTAADVSFLRLTDSGAYLTVFVLGDDTRYFDAPEVNYEQFFSGTVQAVTPVGVRDELGGQCTFLYQHQVLDVSETEALPTRLLVEGYNLALRPHWKRTLGGGWAGQIEVLGLRQLYDQDLDDCWELGGRASAIRRYGSRSEFAAGYLVKQLRYDTREQFDSFGVALPGTSLDYWQHELAAQWRHHWDEARHWRTTTKLGYLISRDNGSGYFDYDRVLLSQQWRWSGGNWEIKATARGGWYFYHNQIVGTEERERSYAAVELRGERRLGKQWLLYVAAEREWNFSNDPLDEYRDWMATAGAGVEF
jgi:hypothetical protein